MLPRPRLTKNFHIMKENISHNFYIFVHDFLTDFSRILENLLSLKSVMKNYLKTMTFKYKPVSFSSKQWKLTPLKLQRRVPLDLFYLYESFLHKVSCLLVLILFFNLIILCLLDSTQGSDQTGLALNFVTPA